MNLEFAYWTGETGESFRFRVYPNNFHFSGIWCNYILAFRSDYYWEKVSIHLGELSKQEVERILNKLEIKREKIFIHVSIPDNAASAKFQFNDLTLFGSARLSTDLSY